MNPNESKVRTSAKTVLLLAGIALALSPFAGAANAAEPPGASAAFTSSDSVILKSRGLMDQGKFKEAEALLGNPDPGSPDPAVRDRAELREIIRRTRFEYSLDADHLLAKIKKSIPDATAKDVAKWADEAKVRFRMIDGQKLYFRREPQNIYLFSEAAKKRLAKNGKRERNSNRLAKHLEEVVAEAEKTGKTEVVPVKERLVHTLTINPNPAIKEGSVVRVWLPFPQEYRQQKNVKLISSSPAPKEISPIAKEGNPVTGGAQRTVYFEQTVTNPAQPLVFQETVEFTAYAYCPKLLPSMVEPLPKNWNGAYLGERLPHITFTPEMQAQVAKIVGKETNSLVKARKIFHWVFDNIPWNAEDEYCTIPSFAKKGFNARRGDCGVQNTVFVTMCRIAGIPARWQSGFERKPGDKSWGMHDWSEIYIQPWGWLPTDATYGVQKSRNPRIADFYCGDQDAYRFIVNLDWGRELYPPKSSLRSEPADFQRGEVEVDGKNLYYDQWDATTVVVEDSTTTAAQ